MSKRSKRKSSCSNSSGKEENNGLGVSTNTVDMYRMKKQVNLGDIELPNCMYKLKPLLKVDGTIADPCLLPNVNGTESTGFTIDTDTPDKSCSPKSEEKIVPIPKCDNKLDDNGNVKSKKSKSKGKKENSNKIIKEEFGPSDMNVNIQMKCPISNNNDSGEAEVTTIDTLETLEKRQFEIINRLGNLREMITKIHDKCSSHITELNKTDPARSLSDEYVDLVVSASPDSPPYSLLFFKKLLMEHYGEDMVEIKSYVHSSYRGVLGKYLVEIFTNKPKREHDAKDLLTISLIWKKTSDDVDLNVNPVTGTSIKGEANFAKFLSRILPPTSINYDALELGKVTKLDELLKMTEGDGKGSKSLQIELLEKKLEQSKSPYLLGETLSIADFVLFSKVTNKLIADYGRLDKFPLLQKWISFCQQYLQIELFQINFA